MFLQYAINKRNGGEKYFVILQMDERLRSSEIEDYINFYTTHFQIRSVYGPEISMEYSEIYLRGERFDSDFRFCFIYNEEKIEKIHGSLLEFYYNYEFTKPPIPSRYTQQEIDNFIKDTGILPEEITTLL